MAGIEFRINFLRGHANEELKKEVQQIIYRNINNDRTRCTQFYIGKTSGNGSGNGDTVKALGARIDSNHVMYKSATHMICLYRTKSPRYCDDIEKAMIAKYKGDRRCKNSGSGGEGRIPEADYYYVYLAMKVMYYTC